MAHHEGERVVQRRAGVKHDNWGSASVSPEIPPVAAEFLDRQRVILIGAVDAHAAAWATMLTGPAGFTKAIGERTIVVNSLPGPDDPLGATLAAEAEVGMLAIEPQTRRRLRINGLLHRQEHHLVVRSDQVYSNCPKYIQVRDLVPDSDNAAPGAGPAQISGALTIRQQRWVGKADTFFVATYATGHGADVSHRGGNPGFVRVLGSRRLEWPDYVGNAMYMTLGNLELNPACGLLFVDWTSGHTLQLTGRARVNWDPNAAAAIPGAQRVVGFDVDQVVQINRGSSLRWKFGEFFRHNPPVLPPETLAATRTLGAKGR